MQLRDLIANLPLLKATDQNPSNGSLALPSRCVEQGSLASGGRMRACAFAQLGRQAASFLHIR